MLTGKTAPPTAQEIEGAHQALGQAEADAVRVVVRDETRPVIRRVGRELAGWLLLITVLTVWGTWRAENTADRVGRESIERQVDACQRTNEFRQVYREDLARRSVPLDPAAVRSLPEYQALPPEVRPFVDFVVSTIDRARDDAEVIRSIYEDQFPLVDCDALRDELGS